MRLFEPLVEHLKLLTKSSGIITVITSFRGSWYGDRLLASRADRVIRRLNDFEDSELTGGAFDRLMNRARKEQEKKLNLLRESMHVPAGHQVRPE